MKISKVNHTRAAVSNSINIENSDTTTCGVLYKNPREKGKAIHNLEKRINALDEKSKLLYNVLTPINLGTKPKEPILLDSKDEKSIEKYNNSKKNYETKMVNYNRRKDFCNSNIVSKVNGVLSDILFNKKQKVDKNGKPIKNKNDNYIFYRADVKVVDDNFFETISNKKIAKAEWNELIALTLRKSLREINVKKILEIKDIERSPISNTQEGLECLLTCIGKQHISAEDKEKISAFVKCVDYDYNKISNSRDNIVRSITNQNLVFQPNDGVFGLSQTNSNGKSESAKKTKEMQDCGLEEFLSIFADLNEKNRTDLLRRLRRVIELYFEVSRVDYEKNKALNRINIEAFNIWSAHENGKNDISCFVDIPKTILEKETNTAVDAVALKHDKEQLFSIIKEQNKRCFRETKRIIEDNPEYFFNSENINFFWLRHISTSIEKILKNRVVENIYKLQIGFLREKVWKDALNYISVKYISLGKVIYNFGMEDLELNKEEQTFNLGQVKENISGGISSFDYEIIKARETLQREVSVHIAFAVNNLARATVNVPEDNSDFLLWSKRTEKRDNIKIKIDDIKDNRLYENSKDLQKRLLQFFGGKSQWENTNVLEYISEKYPDDICDKLLYEIKDMLYELRNENFHFNTFATNTAKWNDELMVKLFENELRRCVSEIKNRIYSNNLPLFYSEKDLEELMNLLYKNQVYRAAQIPSFNSVISRNKFKDFLYSQMNYKKPVYDKKLCDKWIDGNYYLFKEIYYNGFLIDDNVLKYVINATKMMERDANYALNKSYKNNSRNKKELQVEKNATTDFKRRVEELGASKLEELCQIIISEYNYQNSQIRKVKKGTPSLYDKEIFKHYKMLLNKALAVGFSEYVKENKIYEFIKNPYQDIGELPEKEVFLNTWNSSMYSNLLRRFIENKDLQKWYILGKFLNSKSLNLLVGSMRSYRQYISDIKKRAQARADIKLKEETSRMKDVIKVLDVCIKLSTVFSNNVKDYFEDNEDYADYLSKYLDFESGIDIKDSSIITTKLGRLSTFCNGLNPKEENTNKIFMDAKNPILNRNVIMSKLFGVDNILEKVTDKITNEELLEYYKALDDISNYRRTGECKTKDELDKIIKFQRLKNRVELRDHLEYSEILNELQGQLLNWSFLRERDLLYFQLGFHYNCLLNDTKKPLNYITINTGNQIINNAILRQIVGLYVNGIGILAKNDNDDRFKEKTITGSVGGKIGTFIKYAEPLLSDFLSKDELEKFDKISKQEYIYCAGLEVFENVKEHDNLSAIRNAIDHFKYYRIKQIDMNIINEKEYPETNDYMHSILDYYSELFDRFFTYDIKYKKNVVNMIYNILLRHHIITEYYVDTGTKIIGVSNEKKGIKAERKNRAAIKVKRIYSDKFTYKLREEDTQKEIKLDGRDRQFVNTVFKLINYPYQTHI